MIALRSGFLCSRANCVVAERRPPGGPWGPDEPVANVAGGDVVNGLAVTANPDSSYTAVWAEVANPEGIAPPGRVLSSDRQAGDAGVRDGVLLAGATARRLEPSSDMKYQQISVDLSSPG